LMGASDGQLPLAGSDRDEERRLFYVGITRAKADLHISYQRTPSPFLHESGLITA
jgi:DNA helicase-2/ATP-dependent DNA helicase PcrA